MNRCIILRGIPLSGKSTFVKNIYNIDDYVVLSCDDLRMQEAYKNGKKYKFNTKNEEFIWNRFYALVRAYSSKGFDIIIDNTNLKEKYITLIKENLVPGYTIEYKYFSIPLWKAFYRNIKRYLLTGKWTPFKIIRYMKINFDKLKH